MKKILMAAGIAATMLFATSAFAETTNSITPNYDSKSGNVTLTGEGVKSRATTTYLVISRGTEKPTGIYTGEITNTMIKQIDQVEGQTVSQILVGAGLDKGFYEVRMGGDGNIAYGIFEVKTVVTPPDLSTQEGAKEYYKTCERLMGDIDGEGTIGLTDAGLALLHELSPSLTREGLQAADVDGEGTVGLTDAGYILSYELGDRNTIKEGSKVKDKASYILEESSN